MLTLYDRIRKWTDDVNVTDPMKELCCMLEEHGELDEAERRNDKAAIADAIGDSGVCLISNDYLLRREMMRTDYIETQTATTTRQELSNLSLLGRIAEGIRKPTKRASCLELHVVALERLKGRAFCHGLDFESDCLALVVPIIESRVATGKLVNGAFVKGSDLA